MLSGWKETGKADRFNAAGSEDQAENTRYDEQADDKNDDDDPDQSFEHEPPREMREWEASGQPGCSDTVPPERAPARWVPLLA
jgi:hypothetical protein